MTFNPIGLPQIAYGAPKKCGAPRVEEAQCQKSVHPEQLETDALSTLLAPMLLEK